MSVNNQDHNREEYDYLLKYIIIRDENVGKSSILSRYIYNKFNQEYNLTMLVEFEEKIINEKIWYSKYKSGILLEVKK